MDVKLNPRLFDVVALRAKSASAVPASKGTVVELLGNDSLLVEMADDHGVAKDLITVAAGEVEVVWRAEKHKPSEKSLPKARQLFEEGLLLLQNGLVDQATKRFAECFRLDSTFAGSLMNLANELAKKNTFESAMFVYQM